MAIKPAKFDPADLTLAVQQWIAGAQDRLDEMCENHSSSVIDIRDAAIFLSGALSGFLQASGIPLQKVNESVHEFQMAMDTHLIDKFPEHPRDIWKHNLMH